MRIYWHDSVEKKIAEDLEKRQYRRVCDRLIEVEEVGTAEAVKAFENLSSKVKSFLKEKSYKIRVAMNESSY